MAHLPKVSKISLPNETHERQKTTNLKYQK